MGYMHIENLYKAQEILEFKRCYAMEKIHGTSAHISYRDGKLSLSPGGESLNRFAAVFDLEALESRLASKFTPAHSVVIYGEAYGGKQQGMSKTYGGTLKFVAFEVAVGDVFLSVPHAAAFCESIGLEFVDFVVVTTDMDSLNAERDKPSVQAVRNGITEPRMREGIVLRPVMECVLNNGKRIMAKHKRAEFSERGTPKLEDIDPEKRAILENAESIALEWVTSMRLEHVIDRMLSTREDKQPKIEDTKYIIELMVEDVTREAAGEIEDNQIVRRHIAGSAAKMFKDRLQSALASK